VREVADLDYVSAVDMIDGRKIGLTIKGELVDCATNNLIGQIDEKTTIEISNNRVIIKVQSFPDVDVTPFDAAAFAPWSEYLSVVRHHNIYTPDLHDFAEMVRFYRVDLLQYIKYRDGIFAKGIPNNVIKQIGYYSFQ
jgi:hypothetical protein